jgi:hypothetical protein
VVRDVPRILGIDNNNVRASGWNEDKVWMGNLVGLTTCSVNFVRHEWHGSIKLANGVDDHGSKITSPENVFKIHHGLHRDKPAKTR